MKPILPKLLVHEYIDNPNHKIAKELLDHEFYYTVLDERLCEASDNLQPFYWAIRDSFLELLECEGRDIE